MHGRQSGPLLLALLLSSLPVPARPAPAEEVSYETADGFSISALFFRPATPDSGAILLFPDPTEGKEAWIPAADSLCRAGRTVLVPDLRGTGGSLLQRGLQRTRASFTVRERAATGMDVQAALRYLRERVGRTADRWVWIASGSAYALVSRANGPLEEPGALVLVSPRGEEGTAVGIPGEDRQAPATLCLVGRDDLVGIDTASLVVARRPRTACWIVEAAGRGAEIFRSREDLIRSVLHWIASREGREPDG